MKTYLKCFPCFARQAVEAGSLATDNEKLRLQIVQEVSAILTQLELERPPTYTGMLLYRKIGEISGNNDPYLQIKKDSNQKAKELLPYITQLIAQSANPLQTALKITAIGNILDFGPYGGTADLKQFIKDKLEEEFYGIPTETFLSELSHAQNILYIADNCGEILFDSLFINQFLKNKKVYLGVRGSPTLNDVTINDLNGIEFGPHVEIVDNGNDSPGAIIELCNPRFQEIYHSVDLVIAKGQGNFEGLGPTDRPNVYSILIAKCPVIAAHLNRQINDLILTIPR